MTMLKKSKDLKLAPDIVASVVRNDTVRRFEERDATAKLAQDLRDGTPETSEAAKARRRLVRAVEAEAATYGE